MRMTINDIARMAGVSKATVSRVLNNQSSGVGEETRKRVQLLIDNLEYRPNLLARGIATSKSKTLGLIIPDITNPFFPELIRAVENCSHENGYTVIFGNTNFSQEKEQSYIATFAAKGVDGVILTSTIENPGIIHERLKKYNIPCVLLDRAVNRMEYGAGVFVDNEYAQFIACEYLIGHGNTNIAFISGPAEMTDPPLTTVQQPTYEMGREATKLLLMLIDGKNAPEKHIRLQPKLILRSTTR